MTRISRGGRTSRAWAVALLVAALGGSLGGVRARADDGRAAVPEPGPLSAAVAELRKAAGASYESKDPEARRALVRAWLERGRSTDTEIVARYAALDQAEVFAERLRDVRAVLDAAGELAATFRVRFVPRALASLEAVGRGSNEPALSAEIANAAVELAGRALTDDDPGAATRALGVARAFAKKAKLGGLVARIGELEPFVAAYGRQAAAARAAEKTVATTPDDAAANGAIGRFRTFGTGRWESGLEALGRSGDGPLADLARRDAQPPTDVEGARALADGWWDWAQKEPDALARARALAHAALLYEKEPAGEPGPRADLVRARLAAVTFRAFDRSVALTKDFSKDGPVSFAVAAVKAYVAQQKIDRDASGWRMRLPRFPDIAFGAGEEYLWRLDTTEGAITVRLFPDTAPRHVANFLYLTELGYFDGLTFHRVVPGFMAQGGCPKGDGTGNPGYGFDGETGSRSHDKAGILSMANTGAPGSDGSQFFLTFRVTKELDGKHTVFGEVVEGLEVLKRLEAQGTPDPGRPKIPLGIRSAKILLR